MACHCLYTYVILQSKVHVQARCDVTQVLHALVTPALEKLSQQDN